ncbi:MAG TPA: YCF48-related protein, partial [Ignavibacteria bacterium]|nr:YCF48-related protein [Ignavibacteria bacterium]
MKDTNMKFIIVLLNIVLLTNLSICQSNWYWLNPLPTGNNLTNTCFTDGNTGWAVGFSGTIIKTTDGGNSWISQTSGVSHHLYSVCFTNSSTGWAVGLGFGQKGGIILNTKNGGTNWITQLNTGSDWLNSVYFPNNFTNSNTGWAVGLGPSGGIIYKTTNEGANWTAQS